MNNKNNWYSFKILYSANKPEELAFDALVFDENTYRILTDDQNLFKNTFLDIINGRLVLYKLNRGNLKAVMEDTNNLSGIELCRKIHDCEEIKTGNAIENIKRYIELNNSKSHKTLMSIEEVSFYPYMTISYSGPDFNYNKGMNLISANKASKNTTAIFRAANDVFDIGEQITIPKAGSLRYELYTTIDNVEAANFLENIIRQCNNHQLDLKQYDEGKQEAAKKIVRSLYEVSRIKELKTLNISLRTDSSMIVELRNLKNLYNSIRENYKEMEGIPDRFSNKNKAFTIGTYSFYFNRDDDNIKEYISLVKYASENKKQVKVAGTIRTDHPQTIDVERIEEVTTSD